MYLIIFVGDKVHLTYTGIILKCSNFGGNSLFFWVKVHTHSAFFMSGSNDNICMPINIEY